MALLQSGCKQAENRIEILNMGGQIALIFEQRRRFVGEARPAPELNSP